MRDEVDRDQHRGDNAPLSFLHLRTESLRMNYSRLGERGERGKRGERGMRGKRRKRGERGMRGKRRKRGKAKILQISECRQRISLHPLPSLPSFPSDFAHPPLEKSALALIGY